MVAVWVTVTVGEAVVSTAVIVTVSAASSSTTKSASPGDSVPAALVVFAAVLPLGLGTTAALPVTSSCTFAPGTGFPNWSFRMTETSVWV
jgi:hypothetical protein